MPGKISCLKIIALLLICSCFSACNKADIAAGTPKCIARKIKKFDKETSCKDAEVREYLFQGKAVYTFEPGSCGADESTEVLDDNCNMQGNLGGISGNRIINGEEFTKATFVKSIWKK
ncbi:MAG: hypothetical protein IPP32_08280 [Bacteroidetes bacterium]|nr:hypothetical protein [Bacteroidota bacterium]